MASGNPAQFRVVGAALESLHKRYGGLFDPRVTTGQAITTAANIVPADAERVFLAIINLSPNNLFIVPQGVPSQTRGIKLGPLGGMLIATEPIDGIIPALEWNGVADAINTDWTAISVRRDVLLPSEKA